MPESANPKEVGLRLRAIFKKLGITTTEAAAQLGEKPANLGNNVNGYALPRPHVAYELEKMLPGVTLQWIYFGDDRLVPGKLSRELAIFVEIFRKHIAAAQEVAAETKAELAKATAA